MKAEIYERVESEEGELVHMKKVGLVWLRGQAEESISLEDLVKRLKEREDWDAFD